MRKVVQIHPDDNVLVALTDLKAGTIIEHNSISIPIMQDIPAKHKVVVHDLSIGESIIMYGVLVGKTTQRVARGFSIHTGNVKHEAAPFAPTPGHYKWHQPDVSTFKTKTFMGFHRSDGQVGTANYWLIIPLVFCENRNVQMIGQAFNEVLGFTKPDPYKDFVQQLADDYRTGSSRSSVDFAFTDAPSRHRLFPNIDGIKLLTHEGGCGGTRQDSDALCALLAGYIHHPNTAGATILSLGCQHAQVSILQQKLHQLNPDFKKPLLIFEQQKEGTEQALLTKAIRETFTALKVANETQRQPTPLSKLVVGLECGGSDGFSGISANPAIGHTSDLIAALGGASILSEFPELCGVEQNLINRCVDQVTATRFDQLMRAYAKAAEAVGSGFDMNPSPGNIKDGLITDAIKSAGAAKKGGTSPVCDVLDYTEYVRKSGLTLLCTPGNDVESTTAMAGSGANVMLFTTGLGTPTGNPIVPVIKISSNTALAQRMPDVIDYDAGAIIRGEKTIEQCGEEILDLIIAIASGEKMTKATMLQQDDFIPWKRGVSL